MPIDTENKRAGAASQMLTFLTILPAPDGTVDDADRSQVGDVYPGIATTPPVPGGGAAGGSRYRYGYRATWPS